MRAAAPIMTALALLAACGSGADATCPGTALAVLRFSGTRVASGHASLGGELDPAPSLPDCEPALGYGDDLPGFVATLTADARTRVAALCRPGSAVLLGYRSGDRLVLETRTDGAVLGGCAPNCSANVRVAVRGDLAPADAATSFSGALVEIVAPSAGACGTCALPCAARYLLSGTP